MDKIEYLIVNDGSLDDTVEVAKRWGVNHIVNFKKNKGYGTKEHIDAIKKYGIISSHRKTFTKKFINQ